MGEKWYLSLFNLWFPYYQEWKASFPMLIAHLNFFCREFVLIPFANVSVGLFAFFLSF